MAVLVTGLRGVFTGLGFAAKGGRHPTIDDAGYLAGPIDLRFEGDPPRLIHAGSRLARRSGDRVIDGRDRVALPGWFDAHTHALFAGSLDADHFGRWRGATLGDPYPSPADIREVTKATTDRPAGELRDALARRLQTMRRAGVACVEVKSGFGGDPAAEIRLLTLIRQAGANARGDLPDVRSTFLALHAPSEHHEQTASVDAMIGLLPRIAADGLADFVDACSGAGYYARHEALRFIARARHYRLPARIHCPLLESGQAADRYARLGVVALDDMREAAREAIPRLATHDTVATLLPVTSLLAGGPAGDARGLIDAGVRVALASDYGPTGGTAPGLAVAQLLAASTLRMTPAEILCASTVGGALALGLPAASACLAPGFPLRHLNLWGETESLADTHPGRYLGRLFLSAGMPLPVTAQTWPAMAREPAEAACRSAAIARPDHLNGV